MSIRICLPLVLLALLIGVANAADHNSTSAEDFLTSVIESDFRGDPDARLGHVTFSSRAAATRYEKEKQQGGSLPEVYFLDMDPLVVVRGWKISSVVRESAGTCLLVEFNVVATSVGQGLPSWASGKMRELHRVKANESAHVRYCATLVNEQWALLDPPIPRVEQSVLVAFLQKELLAAEARLRDVKTSDPRARRNMQVVRDAYASQLKVLTPP